MADTISLRRNNWQPYALLLLFACIIYFPVALGVYSLKNDGLVYFLTWRYHVSESIQSGQFPFWNPYLFTGLPLHSDMQSGVWNPIVLIISCFSRYNMQLLELELVFYIFMAGAGMYKLIKTLGRSGKTAFVIAISYMCCGFITDSASFIPWIICAAYLPFVFTYFYKLLDRPSLRMAVLFGIFLSLLFTAGNPSYFILSLYILVIVFISWALHTKNKVNLFKSLGYFTASVLVFCILVAPAAFSYIEFLPYYYRGGGANLQQALLDPFPPFSSISFLLPNAVARSHPWLETDIAMRNTYLGLFMLLFFFISFTGSFRPQQKFVLGVVIFSFLFSLGNFTPLRKWCFQYLPMMNTFRHPAISRIFTIIGILILASHAMDQYLSGALAPRRLKKAALIMGVFICGLLVWYIPAATGIRFLLSGNGSMKNRLDTLSFASIATGQAFIQLLFIALFLLFTRRKTFIRRLMIANVIVFAWMALPFTFISQIKTGQVNKYLNSFPAGYPLPDLKTPILANERSFAATDGPYGYSKFFDKKITIQDNIISPTINTDYIRFLHDSVLRVRADQLPFAYLSSPGKITDSLSALSIANFTSSSFSFNIKTASVGYLHLFQQYHHYWKAYFGKTPAEIEKDNIAFMKVALPAGESKLRMVYSPPWILYVLMYMSVLVFLLLIAFITLPLFKNKQHG